MRRLHVFFLPLAALTLIAAGCGGGGGGGGDNTPDTRSEAIQQCKDQAGKISDQNARDLAEQACEGDRKGTGDAAKQQCLDAANQLPAGAARDQAVSRCNSLGG